MIQKSALHCACSALAGVFLAVTLAGGAVAADGGAPADQSAKAPKKKKAAKPKSAKVKFLPSSEESRAERRARLKIECRDAANAGVCTGYTR